MKIGMISLMGKPPTRLSSHSAGWTFALQSITNDKFGSIPELLTQEDDISQYDMIIINNGVNFNGKSWNFIGGIPKTLPSLLQSLSSFKGRLVSYNVAIDLNELLTARKELTQLDWPNKMPNVELLNTWDGFENVIIGDSHSLSVYRPGWGISRNDGKTLFGALKGGWINEKINGLTNVKKLHLYFGNIDIRFHIARQSDVAVGLNTLFRSYVDLIGNLQDSGVEVTVQGLLPIEDESRKIPGTGLYKGEPFYGDQATRQDFVNRFNKALRSASNAMGFSMLEWGFEAPLSFDVMEGRQSVHIRPANYYFRDFTDIFNPQPKQNNSATQQSLF